RRPPLPSASLLRSPGTQWLALLVHLFFPTTSRFPHASPGVPLRPFNRHTSASSSCAPGIKSRNFAQFSTDGTTHRCGKVDSHQPPMSLVPMWQSTSLREIPAADASSESLAVTARVSCLSFRFLSIAFEMPMLFGNPELPVTNTLPLRRTTNAPVGTVRHQTTPS